MTSFDIMQTAGGAEISVRFLATELSRRGHEVHIFHGYGNERTTINCASNLVIHSAVGPRIPLVGGILSAIHIYREFVRENSVKEFDVVDFSGPLFGIFIGRLRRLPTVFTTVDNVALEFRGFANSYRLKVAHYYFLLRLLEIVCLKMSRAIVVQTENNRREFLKNNPELHDKICVIPLSVDHSWFDPSLKFGRANSVFPNFIYVGAGKKRFTNVFIESLLALNKNGIKAQGVVLREDCTTIDRISKELGISITCYSRVEERELKKLFASSAAYVLPSPREGFARSVVEAASVGTPSLVSPLQSVQEFVKDGENGFVIHSNDPREWAKYMKNLLQDPKLWHKLSNNARKKSENYDVVRICDKVETLYNSLAGSKPLSYR